MRLLLICGVAILAAACGSGGEGSNAPSRDPRIAVRSEEQDQLHQLEDGLRDIAMRRAITASGQPCRRVDRSGYVTEYRNLSMWSATCDETRQWAIFVGPDGSAQVRPCEDMGRFSLPACRIAEDPSGRTIRGIAKEGAKQSQARRPSPNAG
jgi:hypothetical protein